MYASFETILRRNDLHNLEGETLLYNIGLICGSSSTPTFENISVYMKNTADD